MMNHSFPPQAQQLISTIEALLEEAQPLLDKQDSDADTYALRETQQAYLPQTLAAYTAVPLSLRAVVDEFDDSAESQLVAALTTLERATRFHLANLAATRREALSINQRFLEQRFADHLAPETHQAQQNASPAADTPGYSTTLVRTFFDTVVRESDGDDRRLLSTIGARFEQAFPRLTRLHYQLFSRTVNQVEIEIPGKNASLCYRLQAERHGIEASVTQIVRGIALKTETTSTDMWIQALTEHLSEFTTADRETQKRLAQLFS